MDGEGVRWSRLVAGAGLSSRWAGSADPIITCVVEDSRQVRPGACFVAMRGLQADGHAFVDSAVQAGASAVVTEQAVRVPESVPALRVDSARGVAGRLAAVLHGVDELQRSGRLKLIGITGTNGKSTFCHLVRGILQAANHPTAMLGTIQYDLVGRTLQADMTTPPSARLVEYLAEAARAGATHAVMEVSSHALDQGRCDGLRFDVGVFSNLTGDHLDYHKDMGSYLRAKKRLFDGLDADAVAVVNQDDGAWDEVVADCRARVIGYGIERKRGGGGEGERGRRRDGETEGRRDNYASVDVPDVFARIVESGAAGTRFELCVRRELVGETGPGWATSIVASSLVGLHNVQNCLAAAGAAVALGVPLERIASGLASVRCVPGRLQRVEAPASATGPAKSLSPSPANRPAGSRSHTGSGTGSKVPQFTVLVDYAHTDDALENVLSALKPLTDADGGKLILLFGCGGDRDRTKRPRMARTAARWADRIVVTSDNPRTEDPDRIIAEIMGGFEPGERERVQVEPDRRRAIETALGMAGAGDIVLLAGKGHEDYQVIGHERRPFDDGKIAAELLGEMMNDER